jgi:hypothetical protein
MRVMGRGHGLLWRLAPLCVVGVLVGGNAGGAAACLIDGIPSLSANGHLAAQNQHGPTPASYLTWSPFVIQQHVRRGEVVRLSEDRDKLKNVLAPAELHSPWRWTFGDGTSTIGAVGSHRYSRPGTYRVMVAAYFAAYRAWVPFDSAMLTITA